MAANYIIRNKPIHIGKMIWIGDSYQEGGVNYKEMCLSNGENLVYCVISADTIIEDQYFFFQYKEAENTDRAFFIGTRSDFELVEIDWQDLDGISFYTADNYSKKLIVKSGVSEYTYYYYIGGELLFDDSDFLYGDFVRNEQILLNFLYKEPLEPFAFESYLHKKQSIKESLRSLNINNFAEGYDEGRHIDSLMFEYVQERISKEKEYDRKYIAPKLLIWGK